MKFGVNLPIDHIAPAGEFQTPEAVEQIARALDASRFEGCCLTDHPAPDSHWLRETPGGHDALDPFSGLAFVASLTRRIKLITNVVVAPYRSAFITAKSAATLQTLSGGRFILGIAAGYQEIEFAALGVPFRERGARTDEAIEVIRAAWVGGPVVSKGRFHDAASVEPRPTAPAPPIWVGGGSDKAAERAARLGDAWLPVYFPQVEANRVKSGANAGTLIELKAKIERVRDLRVRLGKTDPFSFAVSSPLVPPSVKTPTADQYLEAIATMDSLGISHINISVPAPSRAAYLDRMAWFDEEVIARVAGAA